MYSSCCICGMYSLKIKLQYSWKMLLITNNWTVFTLLWIKITEQYILLGLKGSSSIVQLYIPCRKMLALLSLASQTFHRAFHRIILKGWCKKAGKKVETECGEGGSWTWFPSPHSAPAFSCPFAPPFRFLLYCLAGVTEHNSPGPWILKPVASGVRWARANPLFHK